MRGFVAKIAFSVALLLGVECGAFATELKGAEIRAAELSRTEVNVLPESDLWVVGDSKLSARDMLELQLMLASAQREGRFISLEFPNLLVLPAMECEVLGYGAGEVEVAYGAYGVVSLTMPRVVKIGDDAFRGSFRLHTINIPKATHIGRNAFAGCSGVVRVEAPAVEYYLDGAFYGVRSVGFVIPTQPKTRTQIRVEGERVAEIERALELERGKRVEQHSVDMSGAEDAMRVDLKRIKDPLQGVEEVVEIVCAQVEVIGANAFAGCEDLRYLNLATAEGVRIKRIDAAAFEGLKTKEIELTVGVRSKGFVEGNSLTLGRFSAEFKRIKIRL